MATRIWIFFSITVVFVLENSSETSHNFKLNDGNSMPIMALGTSLGHLADGTRIRSQDGLLATAVSTAIQRGYRHIDTASVYLTEEEVGADTAAQIEAGTITRQDIFITTKLWNNAHERPAVLEALRESLRRLKMDYVDLYLMHYPMAYTKDGKISNTSLLETWKGMEDAKSLHLTRSIGVSNFNLNQIKRLYDNADIKPAVLQIEVNPTITQDVLVDWCQTHGLVVQAYSPFGAILGRKSDAPGPRANHTVFVELGRKYGKTTAQILLRYLVDRNIAPIARSTNPARIAENINIFDFALTRDEIARLSSFNMNYRLRTPAKWYDHPEFPFEKKNLTDAEKQQIIENSKED